MIDGVHVIVYGRVQGVGFRYSTCDEARRLGLHGWVRNRADGCVEAFFEGPREDLENILTWCHTGPRWASVTHVQYEWKREEQQYDSFSILG